MLDIERLSAIYDVVIRKMQLRGARGISHKTQDGYLVIVDENLCDELAARALDHEFLHILLGHFDEHRYKSLDQKEQEVSDAMRLLWGPTWHTNERGYEYEEDYYDRIGRFAADWL